jgi:hypothetical protein
MKYHNRIPRAINLNIKEINKANPGMLEEFQKARGLPFNWEIFKRNILIGSQSYSCRVTNQANIDLFCFEEIKMDINVSSIGYCV